MSSIPHRVLILGGTSEARSLAAALVADGVPVTSSLAGRVARPRMPEGEVRVGGFGGPDGLVTWLADHDVAAVVDATHPFAERISTSAATGCATAGVPLLRLERPGWRPGPDDDWRWVDSLDDAAALVPALGSRVFLTSGRQGLAAFAGVGDVFFLARCVDPPEPPLPPRIEVLLSRGPYRAEDEAALLREHRIDVLVTKDSGGTLTEGKLTAARELGIPVVLVRRPDHPDVAVVTDVDRARTWVAEGLRIRDHAAGA